MQATAREIEEELENFAGHVKGLERVQIVFH